MTKAELIEKYGIEWYEAHKEKQKLYDKQRYKFNIEFREHKKKETNTRNKDKNKFRRENDPKYVEYHKIKAREWRRTQYVKDDRIDLIENYELAKADNFKGWDIHHRLEIHDDYVNTPEELKMMNLYYDRPPEELIYLKHGEHMKLHRKKKLKEYNTFT